jgi:hypothetical protein
MALGDNCSSRCETRDHQTFGECVRNKGVSFQGSSLQEARKWDNELNGYASAVKQGMQPDGTTTQAVQQALDISDKAGAGYGVDFANATPLGA